jgi:hypothetical protein
MTDVEHMGYDLTPGKWALYSPAKEAWNIYYRVLKARYPDHFRVWRSQGHRETGAIYVVIEVKKPITIDDRRIFTRAIPYDGRTPEDMGWWVEPPPSWTHSADEAVQELKTKLSSAASATASAVESTAKGASGLIWAGAALAAAVALFNLSRKD